MDPEGLAGQSCSQSQVQFSYFSLCCDSAEAVTERCLIFKVKCVPLTINVGHTAYLSVRGLPLKENEWNLGALQL